MVAGYGSGDGYGSGYGYGDGYGDGYGYGYGYGYGEYWAKTIAAYVDRLPDSERAVVAQHQDEGATIALWRSDQSGKPCNGGRGRAVEVGQRQKVAGPLQICTQHALHATYQPHKYTGDALWLVALLGEIQTQDDKLAALERVIIARIS